MYILGRISIHGYLWIARQIQDIFLPLCNHHLKDIDCWNRHSHKWNDQDYHRSDWHPNRLKQRDSLLHGISFSLGLFYHIGCYALHQNNNSPIAKAWWFFLDMANMKMATRKGSTSIVKFRLGWRNFQSPVLICLSL